MAHYALLDEDNTVTQVITGRDEDPSGIDWEQHYASFMGQPCKRTSYNTRAGEHRNGGTPFRKNYAGIGYNYDEQRDAFIPPRPYVSWALNETTCQWEPPIPMPSDGQVYVWQESSESWETVQPFPETFE